MSEKKDLSLDITLYPKQYDAIKTEATEVLYGGSLFSGKLLSVDTPLLTTEGWKTMATVCVGDYVFNEKGEPTQVVAKSDVSYERTFKMWFDKYTYIIAGENHDWVTLTQHERNANHERTPEYREWRRQHRAKKRAEGKPEKPNKTGVKKPELAEANRLWHHDVLPMIEPSIRNTLEIYNTQKNKTGGFNHSVQTTEPIQFPERELPLDPYVLGVWLGDGGTGTGMYYGQDHEIADFIREKGFEVSSRRAKEEGNCYVYTVKGLRRLLQDIGVLDFKRIPDMYLYASVEQRLELLRGVLDTDGFVEDHKSAVSFSLSHESLAEDVHELITSLGIKCNRREREAKLYGVKKKNRHRTLFFVPEGMQVFKLPRHLARLQKDVDRKSHARRKLWYITDVEEIEPQPLQCLQVDCESHMYLVGEHLIPTHNSFLLRYATILYGLYIPGIQIYLFRRNFADLKKNHLFGHHGYAAVLEPFIKAGKVAINYSDMRIDFFHEQGVSQIFLCHLHHAHDVQKYQGSEMHFLCIDESTHFTKSMYVALRNRLRLGTFKIDYEQVKTNLPWVQPGFFPRILCCSNPTSIGMQFHKQMWVDPVPPNTLWQAPAHEGGMKRLFIPATLRDNIFGIKDDPDYEARVRGGGDRLAEALIEGRWDHMEGGAISDVWDEDVHVIEPFVIPENAHVVRALDWGTFHPSAIAYILISNGELIKMRDGSERWFPPQSQIVIHEIYNWNGNENEGSRMSATEVGRQMARFEAQQSWFKDIRKGPADNQIFQNRGGIYQTIHDLLVMGYNNEMEQISQTDESFSWPVHEDRLFIRADQSANSRVNGLNLVRAYLKAAAEGEDEKGLYFVNTCRHCLRTIPTLPLSEANPEDVDTKAEDHLYDVVRYNCLSQKGSFEQLDILGI